MATRYQLRDVAAAGSASSWTHIATEGRPGRPASAPASARCASSGSGAGRRKTAGVHVSNILARLDVHTRGGTAARAERGCPRTSERCRTDRVGYPCRPT